MATPRLAPLSTARVNQVRHAITRALANQARMIRLPVHVELSLGRYAREQEQLTQAQRVFYNGLEDRPELSSSRNDHLFGNGFRVQERA